MKLLEKVNKGTLETKDVSLRKGPADSISEVSGREEIVGSKQFYAREA